MTYLVDSHCHLSSLDYTTKAFKSKDEMLSRAISCGVSHFLSIACTIAEYQKMDEMFRSYPNIWFACGIHPLNLDDCPDWKDDDLKAVLKDPKCVALGETGLDYFYEPEKRKAQMDSFARQLDIAVDLKKPVCVHAREAHKDTVALLRSENARDCGGVIHCFTDSVEMARECLDLGFLISFTGISTFKAAENVREVLNYVPADRIMVETDCPYLAPVPVRGVQNEPAFTRYTLNFIAKLKGISQKALCDITSRNFSELYNVELKVPPKIKCEFSDYKIEKIKDLPFSS